jgi:hypothetical protein
MIRNNALPKRAPQPVTQAEQGEGRGGEGRGAGNHMWRQSVLESKDKLASRTQPLGHTVNHDPALYQRCTNLRKSKTEGSRAAWAECTPCTRLLYDPSKNGGAAAAASTPWYAR